MAGLRTGRLWVARAVKGAEAMPKSPCPELDRIDFLGCLSQTVQSFRYGPSVSL